MTAAIPIDENMIKNAQQARKVGVDRIVISVRADAILQAAERGEPEVPLCGGHAEAWFCERDHLPGDHGCVVCAFQPAIERAARAQRSDQWIVAKETALNVFAQDGKPTLCYSLVALWPTFADYDGAIAFIKRRGLPLGWVAIRQSRLFGLLP